MTTIAIMQPYFAPYAGYFRLMEVADIFVVYDCVQFPRRGWVHRNKLSTTNDTMKWLTLPLLKQPQEIQIKDLLFVNDAQTLWTERLLPFQHHQRSQTVWDAFSTIYGSPPEFIENLLRYACTTLNIETQWIRSSSLSIPPSLKGQERILEIVRRIGGTTYVNLSGGIHLYDPKTFKSKGVHLRFLQEYAGAYTSIFQRLLTEAPQDIRREIVAHCRYQ